MNLKYILGVLLMAVYAHARKKYDFDTETSKYCATLYGAPESEHDEIRLDFTVRCFHKCAFLKLGALKNDSGFDLDEILKLTNVGPEEINRKGRYWSVKNCYIRGDDIDNMCDKGVFLYTCLRSLD